MSESERDAFHIKISASVEVVKVKLNFEQILI